MAQQDLNAFADAYTNLAKINQYDAQQTAGNKLATGDFSGATNTLYRAGDIAGGQQVQQYSDTQRVQHAQAAQRISQGIRAAVQAGHTPQEAFAMAVQLAPQMGVDPADVAKLKPAFDQDPVGTLNMVDQQAKKELQFFQTDSGILAGDKATGKVAMAYGLPGKPIAMDPDKNYIQADTPVGPPGAQQPPGALPPTQQAATPQPSQNADAVWAAMKQRESGGNGNAVSPKGALGSTQMLPATAQAMAQKLGVAWRPDLIRGNSPEALQYQDQLGRAYFDEGVQKYGGDLAKGASYYHGGPNEAIWGPKTQAYAAAVTGGVSAAGGQNPPMQGGAAQDTLTAAPPGYHYIQRAATATDDGGLTPETVTMNAMRYAMTGQLPATGMGKQAAADKRLILNRAGEIIKQYNIQPEDWVTGMAQFKVTQGSLAQVSKVASMVQASENTVVANADLALSLAPKGGGPTGSPVFNRWIQAGRKSVLGDPDVAKFDAALGTVADEYAKVMTSNTGTGGTTSDSARNEAYKRLNSAQNLQQLQGVVSVMKQEMANRSKALAGEQSALTEQLHHGIVPAGQTQPGQPAQPSTQAAPEPAQGPSRAYSQAQITTARRLVQAPNFNSLPLGHPGNPYAPVSAAGFQAIPNGKAYIDDDGKVYVKGRR